MIVKKHFCDVCGKALEWNKKTPFQLGYTVKHYFADEYGLVAIKVCAVCKPLVIKAIEDVKKV